MNSSQIIQRHVQTLGLTLLTILAMALLLGLVGGVIAGPVGFVLACVAGVVMGLMGLRASQSMRLLIRGAHPLGPRDSPELIDIVQRLAARAGLAQTPRLLYIPTPRIMAFSFGSRDQGSIAVTEGLMRQLSYREAEGVLAHEISHLAQGDIPLLMLSDYVFNLTAMLARIGFFLLILNLPLLAMGGTPIAWPVVVLLVAAPFISLLLKLSLSRTREFEADLNAAQLTGNPRGLMNALAKIEYRSLSLMERLFGVRRQQAPIPRMLRTHPDTRERIRKLAELQRQADLSRAPGRRVGRPHPANLHGV